MSDIISEIQKLQGRRGLDPLQQTVFEKGPQASFTPPEVPNVYQEARTIFPSPQVAIQNSGIDWYTLGQNAFDIALKTFSNVEDYMIKTKINGIVDIKDQAQSDLFNLESNLSTEAYNATQQKRNKDVSLVEQLKTDANKIREDYRNKMRGVLTDDHDMIMDPNLDMNSLGLKYQELALAARNSDRDIDRTTNRMLYELERTNKQQAKSVQLAQAWKNAGGERQADNMPLVFSQLAPFPTDKNGVPLAFVERKNDGSWQPKTTLIDGEVVPALVMKDNQWYFNPPAIDAGNNTDIQFLYHSDQSMVPGSYAVSASSAQFTKLYEEMAKAVAKAPVANVGSAALIGTALAQLPDNISNSVIARIPDLDNTEKMKLQLYREHMREGLPMEGLQRISGTTRDSLQRASSAVTKIASADNGIVFGNSKSNPQESADLNNTAQVAVQLLNALGGSYKNDAFAFTPADNGWSSNGQLGLILQKNPGLQPILTRVLATVDQNRGLWETAKDPVKAKSDLVTKILKEQINSSGWVHVGETIDNVPAYIYNPGLIDVPRVIEQYPAGSHNTATWNAHDKALWSDPSTRNRAVAKTVLMSTKYSSYNPKTQETNKGAIDDAIIAARSVVPDLDEAAFRSVLLASYPVEEDVHFGNRQIQPEQTMANITRLAVACSKSVLSKQSNVPWSDQATIDQKLPYIKKTLDDLPNYSDKREGFLPWIEMDLDTGANNYGYMAQVAGGGLPVAITSMKGESGTDYMQLIAPTGVISAGRYTPQNADGRPTMMIPSTYQDKDGRIANEGEFAENMKNLSRGFGNSYSRTIARDTDIPGSYISPANSQNIIRSTDLPYTPKRFQELYTNVFVDEPLTNADNAIASLRQNGKALEDVVDSDPILKKTKKFLYEFTNVPNSGQTNDADKILFSNENLELLYKQALDHGAKTQADFVGFVLGAMHNAYTNKDTLPQRDFDVQHMVRASNNDDVSTGPFQKGRILWKENSDKFFDVVVDNVRKGAVIVKGPSIEDDQKNAYFVVDPNNITDTLTKRGYSIVMDATKLPEFEKSAAGMRYNTRHEVERVRGILYPPVAQANTDSVAFMARQTTLPADLAKQFNADFTDLMARQNLFDYPDIPFVDWSRYYADHHGFPDSMKDIEPKYILPGHSSTLRWVDQRERPDSFGRVNELNQNVKNAIKGIQGLNMTDAELEEAEKVTQFPLYFPGKVLNLLENAAAYPLGAVFGFAKTVQDSLSRGIEGAASNIHERSVEAYRQQVLDEYNKNPLEWYSKVFGGDDLTNLRQTMMYSPEPNNIPEKFFDVVHFISSVKPPYEESIGLTKEAVDKIESLGLSPVETEYQIRLNVDPTEKDPTVALNDAISKTDPTKFKLSSREETQFARVLHEASKNTQNPLTLDEAYEYAKNPEYGLDLKRAFFNLELHPAGYITKTKKTKEQTEIDTLTDLLNGKEMPEAKVRQLVDTPNNEVVSKEIQGMTFNLEETKSLKSLYDTIYGKDLADKLIAEAKKNQTVNTGMLVPSYSDESMDQGTDFYRYYNKNPLMDLSGVRGLTEKKKENGVYVLLARRADTVTKLHEAIHAVQFRDPKSNKKVSEIVKEMDPSLGKKALIISSSDEKDGTKKRISYVMDPYEFPAHVAQKKAEYYQDTGRTLTASNMSTELPKFKDWISSKETKAEDPLTWRAFKAILEDKNKDSAAYKIFKELVKQVALNFKTTDTDALA